MYETKNAPAGPETADAIDGQELELLQNLVAMMLKDKKCTATIDLKDFLAMAGMQPVDQRTDVGFALVLLSKLGQFYYFPDGLPAKGRLKSFRNILTCTCLAESEDGGTIDLYSRYAEKILEADPDMDLDKYLPIPKDKIADRISPA